MCSQFSVVNDSASGYQNTLVDKENKRWNLYSVVLQSPHFGIQTHFVLSDSPEGAIGMAETAAGCESYKVSPAVYGVIQRTIQIVPFSIRGWGKDKF